MFPLSPLVLLLSPSRRLLHGLRNTLANHGRDSSRRVAPMCLIKLITMPKNFMLPRMLKKHLHFRSHEGIVKNGGGPFPDRFRNFPDRFRFFSEFSVFFADLLWPTCDFPYRFRYFLEFSEFREFSGMRTCRQCAKIHRVPCPSNPLRPGYFYTF